LKVPSVLFLPKETVGRVRAVLV